MKFENCINSIVRGDCKEVVAGGPHGRVDLVATYTATIYLGLKNRASGQVYSYKKATKAIQAYVDKAGLCVTVTPTRYYYTDGSEKGVIIGLINYPRFPTTPKQIKLHSIKLAELLRKKCKQLRVSIVFPNKTIMLSEKHIK